MSHPRLAVRIAAALAAATTAAHAAVTPLAVDCRGARTAAPTVILSAGAFGTSADWDYVLDDLAPGGRACAFDRAGLGGSLPRDGAPDALAKAAELGDLLDQLGETAPVILVGHSNGALYAETFAKLHPERVAGLVAVDGVGAAALESPLLLADLRQENQAAALAVTLGRLGLGGLAAHGMADQMGLRPEAAARKYHGLVCQTCLMTARDEDRLMAVGLSQSQALGPLNHRIPVVVINGDTAPAARLSQAWRTAEVALAAGADRSWILDMPGATHTSPLTRDRAYVAAAVNWLRSLTPLPDADVGH